jgi:hypothetical protein
MTHADDFALEYGFTDSLPEGVEPTLPTGNVLDVAYQLRDFNFSCLKTGLPYVDVRKLLLRGAITRVGAASSIGKSTFAYWLSLNLLQEGYRGMFFSTEVRSPLVLANFLKVKNAWSFDDIVNHRVAPSKDDLLSLGNLDIHDVLSFNNSLAELRDHLTRYQPDFVIIDFIQDIKATGIMGNESIYERLTRYAFEIQKIAQEFGCCIIDFSQISNLDGKVAQQFRGLGRLNSLGFKGSGDLFSSADICLVLDRYTPFDLKPKADEDDDDEPLDYSEFRIGVKKHKYGMADRFKIYVDLATGRFTEEKDVESGGEATQQIIDVAF